LSRHCGGLLRLAYLLNPLYCIIPVLTAHETAISCPDDDDPYRVPWKWNRHEQSIFHQNWSGSLFSWHWSFTGKGAELPCSEGNICTLHHPADSCISRNTSELEVKLRLHGSTFRRMLWKTDAAKIKHQGIKTDLNHLMVIGHLTLLTKCD